MFQYSSSFHFNSECEYHIKEDTLNVGGGGGEHKP